jgi:hypothetical protein
MEDGIRFAETSVELHAAYQLRYETYVASMGRFNDSCDHALQELKDSYDENARIVVAIKNNKAIGTLRVLWGNETEFDQYLTKAYRIDPFLNKIDPAKICIVERLMVGKSHRGSITMLRMFNEVMAFILSQKIELLLINAESQHINTYIKLGCVPFTKQFSYPGIGPVTPMALVVGDYQHLLHVGSPFSLLTTAEDTKFCRHTRQLLDIIQLEATLTATAYTRKSPSTIQIRPAANHPIYAAKSPQITSRLREKLAIA